jgi:hypothetical protein
MCLCLAHVPCCGPTAAGELGELFEDFPAPWLTAENSGGEEEEDELETDRDSFTPATTLVGAGRTIFESSYSFIENRRTANSHSFPEIITRFGVTDRIEFRLGWNYEIGGGGSVSNGDPGGEEVEEPGSVQESQMLYGFKFALTEQRRWLPQTACIIQATTPTSGPDTFTDIQFSYVFGWTIFDDWKLDSSVRYLSTREERDHFNLWGPSVVLKVPVADRWNVHAEYFGVFSDGREQGQNPQYFSPGIHYLISPDCEIGTRVGWGLNQDAANFFANVGLGLRF